jgi:hypothetical protein
MRKIWIVASLVAALLACSAVAEVALAAPEVDKQRDALQRKLPPSPLEAFAARSTATVVWSRVIGHLESKEARATVTAVIVEDRASTPSVMRGLRIDLAHVGNPPRCDWKYLAWRIMCQRANAAVYVEEARLEEVRNGLLRGAAELRRWEFISQYESRVGPAQVSSGLIVCGYQFSDRRSRDLAALFTRAIAGLRELSADLAPGETQLT